jgi:hypothetical protein
MLLFAVEPLSVKMMRETLNLFSTNQDSAINLKTVLKIFFVPRRIAVQIHPWIVLIEIPDLSTKLEFNIRRQIKCSPPLAEQPPGIAEILFFAKGRRNGILINGYSI